MRLQKENVRLTEWEIYVRPSSSFFQMRIYLEEGLENSGGNFYCQLGHRICHSTFTKQPRLPSSHCRGFRTGRSGAECGGWAEEAQGSSPCSEWWGVAFLLDVFLFARKRKAQKPIPKPFLFLSPSKPSASWRYGTPSAPHFSLSLKPGSSPGSPDSG